MQSGDWPFADVQDVRTRILVNGVERPHTSWSVDREISGDLPAQVAYGSGIRQATGSVSWAFLRDVAGDPVSPWQAFGEWLPNEGDRVEVWAGNESVSYMQFTGVLGKTTGSVGGGFQSTLIDDYDKGSARLRHEALLAVMPPAVSGGEFRGSGLVHTYFVDLAFRAMGFYSTPNPSNAVAHVPCQGGIWPHIGTATVSRTVSGASYPTNTYSPWGFVVGDFVQLLTPNNPKSMSNPVQFTAVVAPGHNATFFARSHYGGTYVGLWVHANWVVEARVGSTVVASFTMSGKGGAENRVVQLLVKNGVATIKASNGQTASGSASFSGSTVMDTVRLEGAVGARVSGLSVTHPAVTGEFDAINFKPSAVINVADTSMMGIQLAVPPILDQPANDLLDEISKATLSACWIDETGVMRWWPGVSLTGRSASHTITTLNDVLELEWEKDVLHSASRVSIRYKDLSLRISQFQNVELWRGSGQSLGSNSRSEEFLGAESDTAWYGVDEEATVLKNGNWSLYNNPVGTMLGGYFSQNGNPIPDTGLSLTTSLAKVTHNRYKLTQYTGTLPAGVTAETSTHPDSTDLYVRNRDKPLPRITGHGIAQWQDAIYSPVQAGGVGPELEHDGGLWIPSSAPQVYFDFIAGKTAKPQPVITGLEVVFDPRRQVGDVINISSETYMRVTLKVLVVGVSTSASSSGVSQTLTVRVIEVTSSGQSYRDFNTELPGNMTYEAFNALAPTNQTYTNFNDS